MDSENRTNKPMNRQPSLREQANARMRAASGRPADSSVKTTNKSERPVKPASKARTSSEITDNVSRSAERKTSSVSSSKPKAQTFEPERPVKASSGKTPEKPMRRSTAAPTRKTESKVSSGEDKIKKSTPASELTVKRERPASRDAIKTEREIQYNKPVKKHEPYNARNVGRSKLQAMPKKPKKKFPLFWLAYVGLVIILLMLSAVFLIYTDRSLEQYEKSQSDVYITEYLEEFEEKVDNNSLSENDFTFEALDLAFIDKESYVNEYISSLKSFNNFTVGKDPGSYSTEEPVFNIYGDGEPIAQVTLEAENQKKIFMILTIMDWKVKSVSPICSINVENLTFNIPEGYKVAINGTTVDETYATGNKIEIPDFSNVSEYVDMPSLVEYKVNNVMKDAKITIVDENDVAVSYTQEGNTSSAFFSTGASEMTEERRNNALMMAQAWEDFMTDDLPGGSHGLATIQQYLIKDSIYWDQAIKWANGPDIGFTSAHTFGDPKYSDLVIDNYVEYSENCYSVHIAFTKNMILTRTKEAATNKFDSTIYFVMYDNPNSDSDTPHWCICDIIATTN